MNFELNEYVFHTHTYRCGHALKDIEDYVIEAIKQGYKKFGTSDHVFLPGVTHPGMRGDYLLLGEYIEEFKRCKSLYGNQIEMYLGFECEYSNSFKKYYESLLRDKGFEYLICGQHLTFDDNHNDYWYFTEDQDKQDEGLLHYRDDVISAIKSGLFLYIAHPDLFFLCCIKPNPIYDKVAEDIIEAAIKYDVPIEVNINGMLRNKTRNGITYLEYPNDFFWEKAAKTKVKIVYGGDFHNPDHISNKKLMQKAKDFIEHNHIHLANIDEVWANYQARLKELGLK